MLAPIKEKSWSVRLINAYILHDEVRAKRCQNCKSETEIIVKNYHNPNLLLYGCKNTKCKHRLLRINVDGKNHQILD